MEDSKDKKLSTPRLCKQGTTENKKNGTTILIIYIYMFSDVARRSSLFIFLKVRD